MRKTILLALVLIAMPLGYSYVFPLGVDGVVYDLEGIMRADSNVKFSVENLNNGQYLEGNLRRDGSYSVAIKGNSGDTLVIRAWNIKHNTTRTITLSGVMRGIDLNLNLTLPNYPPVITSVPEETAYEKSLYEYKIEATDPNNDPLTYALLQHPQGMAMSNAIITWTPEKKDAGLHNITILVSDGILNATQEYVLEVIEINNAPVITSMPKTDATEGRPYTYVVESYDEDGDELSFSLALYPPGMTISGSVIRWTPIQTGLYNVTVTVSDYELTAEQSFRITVNEFINSPPVITSLPPAAVLQDELYFYQVEAYDPDDHALFFEIIKGPFEINGTGAIRWTPGNYDVGYHEVKIKVSDEAGGFALQEYVLEVINVNDPPIITSLPVTYVSLGSIYEYYVIAYDPDGDVLDYSLTESPQGMTIDGNGFIRWTPARRGTFNVAVRVSDGEFAAVQEFSILVDKKERSRSSSINPVFVVTGMVYFSDNTTNTEGLEYSITNLNNNKSVKGQMKKELNAFVEAIEGNVGDEIIIYIGKGDYQHETRSKITGKLIREDIKLDISTKDLMASQLGERLKSLLELFSLIVIIGLPFAIILRIGYIHMKR
jgi:hypothetical protein